MTFMFGDAAFAAARPPLPLGQPAKRARAGRTRTAEPRRALFVDFDGVLHPTTGDFSKDWPIVKTPLFGWLPALGRVLTPHPDVLLVVHSTWRYTYYIDELRELLGALGHRVVGATPLGPRYEAIRGWLDINPAVTSYRILDDDPAEFPTPPPLELILCDPRTGVAAPEVLAMLKLWLEG